MCCATKIIHIYEAIGNVATIDIFTGNQIQEINIISKRNSPANRIVFLFSVEISGEMLLFYNGKMRAIRNTRTHTKNEEKSKKLGKK